MIFKKTKNHRKICKIFKIFSRLLSSILCKLVNLLIILQRLCNIILGY